MSVPDEPRHVYLLGGAWFNRLGEGGHIGCTVAENDSDRISFGGECFLAGFVADFDSKPVSPSGLSMDKSSPVIPRGFVDWESRLRFFRARQLILGGQMCSQAPQCSATGEGLSSGCLGDADWNGIQRKLDDWGGQAFQTAWADWWNANRSTWLTGDFGFSEFKSEAFGSGDSNICTGGMDSNDGNSGLDSDESGRLQGCEGTKGKWETTPRKRGREREANTKDKVVQPKAVGSKEVPQRSSGALTGASVKNLCLHCEVSPGTDWPFGLLCDKCHENLSGPQEASHAPQAGNILSCGEVCGIGEACRNEHGTIQGTCTHTKGHDPAVAHMCKPCIDYSSSEEDEQAWNKSLSPCRSII